MFKVWAWAKKKKVEISKKKTAATKPKTEFRNSTRCDGATARQEESRSSQSEMLFRHAHPDWSLDFRISFGLRISSFGFWAELFILSLRSSHSLTVQSPPAIPSTPRSPLPVFPSGFPCQPVEQKTSIFLLPAFSSIDPEFLSFTLRPLAAVKRNQIITFMEKNESIPSSSGVPRREFIKKSASAAAVVATSSLFKTTVYGQAPSTGKVIGANDRIGVAVVGVGFGIGKNHLQGIYEKASENNVAVVVTLALYTQRRTSA